MTRKASSSTPIAQVERAEIVRCLQMVSSEQDIKTRFERLSGEFLGRPYVINSLGGGAGLPEQLTIKLEGFDCVTYMETVFALALARTVEDFTDYLLHIRYHNGKLSWQSRNHYMVDWWQNNEAAGLLQNLTKGEASIEKRRHLNIIKELPEKEVRFRVFLKRNLSQVRSLVETGDFICFATTKKNLDVFHTGILIRQDNKILLRHATRSEGAVVEQPLSDFLQANRMSGFILLRPLQRTSHR